MRIAVAGGKLQGVEACYLAGKAGWFVRLVDCRPEGLARRLCDEFILSDLTREEHLERVFGGVDLIVPALEDPGALDALSRFSSISGIPLAFDARAYRISSSKVLSDRVFAELKVPAPTPWPGGGFPLIAKPSGGSGSRGLRLIHDLDQLRAAGTSGVAPGAWVVQEYLHGPSYSLEVVSAGGAVRCFQVTQLFVDAGYDCKRVLAPADLSAGLTSEFERIGRRIAEAIDLRGLMDVEVVLNNGRLNVLEIDARLPSQTPTAVFWSSGVNLLQVWCEAFCADALPPPCNAAAARAVVYEHIAVRPGLLEIVTDAPASGQQRAHESGLLGDEPELVDE